MLIACTYSPPRAREFIISDDEPDDHLHQNDGCSSDDEKLPAEQPDVMSLKPRQKVPKKFTKALAHSKGVYKEWLIWVPLDEENQDPLLRRSYAGPYCSVC